MADELEGNERVHAAELIAALCPQRRTPSASFSVRAQVADDPDRDSPRRQALGVDGERPQTYYACLLSHAGCTTEAHGAAEIFGGSLTTVSTRLCTAPRARSSSGLVRALPDPESPALVRA